MSTRRDAAPPEPPPRRRRHLAALTAAALLPLAAVPAVRSSVVAPVRVSSGSMLPTLAPGDVVLVDVSGVHLADLQRGDLVTFRSPQDGQRALKRVVGLPGERVVIKDALLHVDGVVVDEPYVDHDLVDGSYSRTTTVPPGTFFVLGDARGRSLDSRDFGPVPQDALEGRVLLRAWPWR